jgi:hypothetical protein
MTKTFTSRVCRFVFLPWLVLIGSGSSMQSQALGQTQNAPTTQMPATQPAIEEWGDDFDGDLSVLFDGNTTNRIEWLLRSDGIFEAWQSVDGKMIRVDNGKLATKEKSPKLGIARRGDKIYFMLNREVGLESTIRNGSSSFKVMLYGFGSSEHNWDSVAVQTLKQ